jgi:hypothetical protein
MARVAKASSETRSAKSWFCSIREPRLCSAVDRWLTVISARVCQPPASRLLLKFGGRRHSAPQVFPGLVSRALSVVLRAIWRSRYGDIWRRCLSRSSIPTFCGMSTGFADSDVSHLPFMACTSSPSEPGLAFMDRVSASNLSCLRQITPQYLRQIISKATLLRLTMSPVVQVIQANWDRICVHGGERSVTVARGA